MGSFKEALEKQFIDQPRAVNPKGWTPGVIEEGDTAVAVSEALAGNPSNDDLIAGWEMDPDIWEIVGDVNVRRWQRYDGEWLRYFKANLRRKRMCVNQADVDELIALITSQPQRHGPAPRNGGKAYVICINDWQLGKNEQGRGSEETVARILSQIAQLPALIRAVGPDEIVIANVGDLTERVSGHYPSQAHTVDLDEREQQKVARFLIWKLLDTVANEAPVVRCIAVPCNHGENRNGNGKAQTKPSDNLSLTLFETVEEGCSKNPDRYGHVTFEYARDLVHVTDVQGITIGVTHGHQFTSGPTGVSVLTRWWRDQIMGMQPIAAAHMLISAHLHHFEMSEEPGRTMILCPANDAGSYWFTQRTGKESPPGMLLFGIGTGYGDPLKGERFWGDLKILSQEGG